MKNYFQLKQDILEKGFQELDDAIADKLLPEIMQNLMNEKLGKKRLEGKGGWHTRSCTNKQLLKMLVEHVEKGDMIDVANFAAMIVVREMIYGDKA